MAKKENYDFKQIFANNLKKYAKEKGFTRKDMSETLDISMSTINRWFAGSMFPKMKTLERIAEYLHVSSSDLTMDHSLEERDDVIPINKNTTTDIPLIGTIACGDPITAEQNIERYIPTLNEMVPAGVSYYLRCKGDSMYPTLKNGSLVLIHEQPTVEVGEIAAVLINNDATLKRIKNSSDGKILLMPDNKDYDPIIVNDSENIKIMGKAIRVTVDL